MDLTLMPWKDIVTVGAAALGAGLGIMNTWNSMSQRQLRLRVTPAFALTPQGDPIGFSIEVINLSSFPITVAEVGFGLGWGRRAPIQRPSFLNGAHLPVRLETREAASIYFDPTEFMLPKGMRLGPAYVRTACGNIIRGDSPARKQLSTLVAEVGRERAGHGNG